MSVEPMFTYAREVCIWVYSVESMFTSTADVCVEVGISV